MNIGRIRKFGQGALKGLSEMRMARKPETLALKRSQAKAYIASISDATWEKMSKDIFVQPNESKSKLLDRLHEIKGTYDKLGFPMPENVAEAFKTLEHKATVFADRMEVAVSKGKEQKNYWSYGGKFVKSHKEAFSIIDNFVTESRDNMMKKWDSAIKQRDLEAINKARSDYSKISQVKPIGFVSSLDLYVDKIREVASDEFKSGQMLYHGTKHAKAILKNGFSLVPKTGQATAASRELGQGIYLTPSKRAASFYAGLKGDILHLKMNEGKIAAVNNNQLSKIIAAERSMLGDDAFEPAIQELIIKTLFQRNGYCAAYSREALGGGFFYDPRKIIDALAGGKQSQVCVFDPSDIKILGKSLAERVENQKMQIGSLLKSPYNMIKGILAARNA